MNFVVQCTLEPSMLAVCALCSFVIILIPCLLTCLLSLAAADSFVELFTVSLSVTVVASLLTCLLFLSDSCSFIVDLFTVSQ